MPMIMMLCCANFSSRRRALRCGVWRHAGTALLSHWCYRSATLLFLMLRNVLQETHCHGVIILGSTVRNRTVNDK
jgi:hypothetical protein